MSSETEDSHLAPLNRFSARLRCLQEESGAPSLNDLVRLTREVGKPYARSTIQAKLAGVSTPDWEFVKTFVAACHHNVGLPQDLSITSWRENHQQMMRELAGLRRGQRRAGDAAARLIPRQLPGALRTFAGRVNELDTLTDLLNSTARAKGAVLISAIDGTAGIGKTALAIYWAHQVADRFPDGQLYVNLRGFDPTGLTITSDQALRSLLSALQVKNEQIPASVEEQSNLYRSLISGKRLLIVLDNARDYAQVQPLLPGEPGCMTLVTTRNPSTGLIAEAGARPLTLGLLDLDEARQLLANHLTAERVDSEPDAASELVRVCAGLPLAVAIVAARATLRPGLPLSALAEELTSRRRLLDAFEGGDLAVRAAFSWSYEQLGTAAARLFRLLGLHPGPDITTLAAASLAGVDLAHATQALAELTRTHLVEEHSPGRFAFHDLLRSYAIELVNRTDSEMERQQALRRSFDHYLQTAAAADKLLNPSREQIVFEPPIDSVTPENVNDVGDAMAWFAAERQVLLAALVRDADGSFDHHKFQLGWTLGDFLERRGYWHDQITAQEIALESADHLSDKDGQARAHAALATAQTRLGLYGDAAEHFKQARDLYSRLEDHSGQAATDLDLTVVLELQGRYLEALGHAREALSLFRQIGHQAGQAHALNAVGWCHAMLGDYQAAIEACSQASGLFDETGDRYGKAATLDTLGYGYHNLGQYDQAVGAYAQALTGWQDLGDRYHEADTLAHIGETHQASGNLQAARYTWRQSLAIFDDLGHPEAEKVRAKLEALANELPYPGQCRRILSGSHCGYFQSRELCITLFDPKTMCSL